MAPTFKVLTRDAPFLSIMRLFHLVGIPRKIFVQQFGLVVAYPLRAAG